MECLGCECEVDEAQLEEHTLACGALERCVALALAWVSADLHFTLEGFEHA